MGNIKHIVPELFSENLIRGRGLFVCGIMKAQASLPFTPVFAALDSILKTENVQQNCPWLANIGCSTSSEGRLEGMIRYVRELWFDPINLYPGFQTVCISMTTFALRDDSGI